MNTYHGAAVSTPQIVTNPDAVGATRFRAGVLFGSVRAHRRKMGGIGKGSKFRSVRRMSPSMVKIANFAPFYGAAAASTPQIVTNPDAVTPPRFRVGVFFRRISTHRRKMGGIGKGSRFRSVRRMSPPRDEKF